MKWPFLYNQGRRSAPTQDGGNLITCDLDNILRHRSTRGLVHTTDRVIVYEKLVILLLYFLKHIKCLLVYLFWGHGENAHTGEGRGLTH